MGKRNTKKTQMEKLEEIAEEGNKAGIIKDDTLAAIMEKETLALAEAMSKGRKKKVQKDLDGGIVKDEWTRLTFHGIEIAEKIESAKVFTASMLGYSIRLSEEAHTLLGNQEEEDVRRLIIGKIRPGPDAKLAAEKGVKAAFFDLLRHNIAADELGSQWIDVDKYLWRTANFQLSAVVEGFDGKVRDWRAGLKDKKAEKQEETRGKMRDWIQHKMRLRTGATVEKGGWDSTYEALLAFIHDKVRMKDSTLEQFEKVRPEGEEK